MDSRSNTELNQVDASDSNLIALRCQAGAAVTQANPVEVINRYKIEESKDQVRYKNGQTLPLRARKLFANALLVDAGRSSRHPRILSRNMIASNQTRPSGVAAHHIVAAKDDRARTSRIIIFGWRIAINDTDNGVFLPRWRNSEVAELPHAIKHSVLHTDMYYLEVFARLNPVLKKDSRGGRAKLKEIRQELIDGVFPYIPEVES